MDKSQKPHTGLKQNEPEGSFRKQKPFCVPHFLFEEKAFVSQTFPEFPKTDSRG